MVYTRFEDFKRAVFTPYKVHLWRYNDELIEVSCPDVVQAWSDAQLQEDTTFASTVVTQAKSPHPATTLGQAYLDQIRQLRGRHAFAHNADEFFVFDKRTRAFHQDNIRSY